MQEEREPPDESIDWASLVEELQALAVSRIGKRARKIAGLLGTAQHSAAGIQATLKEIGRLTITFVDPVAIDDLVYEMEQRLATRAGIEHPPRRGQAPWYSAIDDSGPGSW
jgi:hypothetical protein